MSFGLAIACAQGVPLATRAAAGPFQLEDLRRLVSLSEPQISPDGKRTALIFASPDWKSNKPKLELDLSQIWKAAVAGAALTDWVMDYTVSFYQSGDTYFFGGSPWSAKDRDIWREQSPIAFADKVTAPTLIMGDVGDPNVPLINSYVAINLANAALALQIFWQQYWFFSPAPRASRIRSTPISRRTSCALRMSIAAGSAG